MTATQTRVLTQALEVDPRLSELKVERRKLLNVRDTALAAAADATGFHAANAAGTFSYHYGTFAMRNELVGEVWRQDRPNGVEAVSNDALRLRLVFANVDVACDLFHYPKPRSEKGAGAQRMSSGNLFGFLPGFATSASVDRDGWTVYFIMVDEKGAMELTCAAISGGKFSNFVERLFISDGSDIGRGPEILTDDLPAVEFDPQVARK